MTANYRKVKSCGTCRWIDKDTDYAEIGVCTNITQDVDVVDTEYICDMWAAKIIEDLNG